MGIRRSEDYGVIFSLMGNSPGGQINVGSISGELYALYETQGNLFFSSDSGHSFILVNDSIPPQIPFIWKLRHGTSTGELFLLNSNSQELFYRSDTGRTLTFKYQFNLYPSYEWGLGLVGSQVTGKLFVLAFKYFISGGGEFYIYHSTDYGVTWNSYHHLTDINIKHNDTMKSYYLSQNCPNPFNGETRIEFHLPTYSYAEIFVYDIEGKLIKTLVSEKLPAGNHSAKWEGINNNGNAVASGIYFCRLETQHFMKIEKMFYIRSLLSKIR